jgi:geranylgeranyl diphosphate synthase type II
MKTPIGETAAAGAMQELAAYLDSLRGRIDAALARAMAAADGPPIIARAMDYSLTAGGKRLRPCLTLAAAEACGERIGVAPDAAHALALPAAVAIELIHTYSLIHDDLPAMDDDDLRRGRPTSHVVHGDGLAILAGDGLLTEAFRVLAATPSPVVEAGSALAPVERRLEAIARIASAAGPRGMVGGQAIDLDAAGRVRDSRGTIADAAALADMHARKTGALIRAAAVSGALLVGAPDSLVSAIDDYARELGLAFQIVDDVLDVEGSNAALGKTAGKDAAAGKPTYPAFFGVTGSRDLAEACVVRAKAALERAGLSGGHLAALAAWSLTRTA